MRRNRPFVAAFALAILVALAMSMFTVDQRRFAIVFQLGEIKDVITQPGLNFKWPLIQNVRTFDKRILTYDSPEPERFITAEKKPVLVDAFVKWRIIDVRQYYISVQGDEARAHVRLSQTVNAGLREEFGRRSVHDVVSGARDKIMAEVQKKADADNLRARLAMLGFEANVLEVEVPDKGTMHRVRVGPYAHAEEMNRARNQLSQNGVPATVVRAKD